jgi:hypothetical protein
MMTTSPDLGLVGAKTGTLVIYFAGLGGSLPQVVPYLAHGRLDLPSGHSLTARRYLPVLPPDTEVWLDGKADGRQAQPPDLLRADQLGLDPKGWPAYVLSRPYAWFTEYKTGVHSDLDAIGPIPWWCDVAQTAEVAHAVEFARRGLAHARRQGQRVVLFGRSRGSAVALQVYLALAPEEQLMVHLLWLEGAFLDSAHVIETRFHPRAVADAVAAVLPLVTRWQPSKSRVLSPSSAPTTLVQVPVLVVGSAADTVVTVDNTRDLVDALGKVFDPTHLHYVELERSAHSTYATDDEGDRKRYADALRRYGLGQQ